MLTRIMARWTFLGLALGLMVVGARAQDGAATPAADKSLDELLIDWSILEQQLVNKEKEFNETEDFRVKDDLKKQYVDLVSRANQLIEALRTASLAALDAGENSPIALRTLMGIMVNDASLGLDQRVFELGNQLIERQIDPRYFQRAAALERLSLKNREIFDELLIRQREAAADDLPQVKFETTQGDVVFELFENQAPLAVANFVALVEQGFYDGVAFHRVLEGFVAQTGDATTAGRSGVDYTIPGESTSPEARSHFAGSLAMALVGNDVNSGNSQIYIALSRSATMPLDGLHTVFGRVREGWDVVLKLKPTAQTMFGQETPIPDVTPDKIVRAVVLRKRDHEYRPTKFGEADAPPTETSPPIEPPIGGDQTGGEGDGGGGGGA